MARSQHLDFTLMLCAVREKAMAAGAPISIGPLANARGTVTRQPPLRLGFWAEIQQLAGATAIGIGAFQQ